LEIVRFDNIVDDFVPILLTWAIVRFELTSHFESQI